MGRLREGLYLGALICTCVHANMRHPADFSIPSLDASLLVMAFNDIERKKIENATEAFLAKLRPPAHVRPKLDFTYIISGQSVELCEVRPHWQNPKEIMVRGYAKATYVKTQEVWKVYWKRADLKWHSYPAAPTVKTIEQFLAVVSADEHACFYG